jgi:deoxyribodipyrimidine photo-lyase
VIFGLTGGYPEANLRHYTFMLEGLLETQQTLQQRGIAMAVQIGHPPEIALGAAKSAAALVCDRGYLRHQKSWRERLAAEAGCRVIQVESDVIVPLEETSTKAEYAARTIRPKIHRKLETYLRAVKRVTVKYPSLDLGIKSRPLHRPDDLLRRLDIDRSVGPVTDFFKGGTSQAKRRFRDFLQHRLQHYDAHSNQPQTDDVSGMSPYLHFGQISPLYLAMEVMRRNPSGVGRSNVESYLEELIVRRELAVNFVYYTPDYDDYDCIPAWAKQTLAEHREDKRSHRYSRRQLAAAETHDPYWNAAMREMVLSGFMHNYMRMYWGKKILEWSRTPEVAYRTTLALNNRYFLDGRDPNSYTGVAWIYGVHDRAWKERAIFGKIRYMAASGLRRKCDIEAYVAKVRKMETSR